jgi:hypothetical protein
VGTALDADEAEVGDETGSRSAVAAIGRIRSSVPGLLADAVGGQDVDSSARSVDLDR